MITTSDNGYMISNPDREVTFSCSLIIGTLVEEIDRGKTYPTLYLLIEAPLSLESLLPYT
jgi:hypothetical protein